MLRGVDFYYLRTPVIALPRLLALLSQPDLEAVLLEPFVGEAIFLASPTLYKEIKNDPLLINKKLRQTFLKYLLRMGSRSTPFGLFAGCSLGQLGSTTTLDLSDRQLTCRHRLDTAILWELLDYLNQHPVLRPYLRYSPNTSLYPIGDQLRYLERSSDHIQSRFFISQVTSQPAIRLLLRRAHRGATLDELVQFLTQQGCFENDARKLVEQLLIDQLLVSELAINVTGPDCLARVADWLCKIPGGNDLHMALHRLHTLLINEDPVKIKHKAIRLLFDQDLGISLPDLPILQGDTIFSSCGNQLQFSTLATLRHTLEKLSILRALQPKSVALLSFKRAFYARYEDREMPLSLVLDAESGIGYGALPLADDIRLIHDLISPANLVEPTEGPSRFSSKIESWLHKILTNWLQNQQSILELTDTDLAGLGNSSDTLPASYYVLGYFLATSPQAIDTGHYRFRCKVIAGPSAFPLLGRFGYADQKLTEKLQTAFNQLQANDADRIQAEIVHLPTAQTGNVVQRPHLSDYEIPYLGCSILPLERQITLDDLWVSVPRGERIVLRSRRLGKEIVPRLTSAHNYQTGLPTYRFLCDLQQQDADLAIHWHWGGLSESRYLPRVQYRHIILQEARWRLEWTDYLATLSDQENVIRWKQIWQWPRFIALVQADQELFLDLDNLACRELLASTLRRLERLSLIEWLQTPDQCCVEGPDGKLTHEVILPFLKKEDKQANPLPRPLSDTIQRTFVPGTEWIYLKLYSGEKTASQVLVRLGKLARALIRSRQITHWFFIRYQDPETHLRIRFHLIPQTRNTDILVYCQQRLQTLIKSGEVYRVQVDTYQREVERYGEQNIVATEWIFWADSEAVMAICQKNPDERSRLASALLGVNAYLTDMGYTLADKEEFCQHSFTTLFNEQGAVAGTRRLLAQKYRENQSLITELFYPPLLPITWQDYQQLFKKRSRRILPFLKPMLTDEKRPTNYIANLIHLFLNRLFEQHQRTYELLVYHHLARDYQSQLARKI